MLKHELAPKCLISGRRNAHGQWARGLAEDDHLLRTLSWKICSSNGGAEVSLALQRTTLDRNMNVEATLTCIVRWGSNFVESNDLGI